MNTGLEPDAVSQLIHIYFFIISFECCEKKKKSLERIAGRERERMRRRESEKEIY